MDLLIKSNAKTIRMTAVYRPPPSNKNNLTTQMFFDEFTTFLEKLATDSKEVIICGDFNFHIDDQNDTNAVKFLQMLHSFDYVQHVNESTHKNGHILDLLITRSEDNLIHKTMVSPPIISDHGAIHCKIMIAKLPFPKKEIKYRNLKRINMTELRNDLHNSSLFTDDAASNDTADKLVNKYNNTLSTILDKHAPIKERVITLRPVSPWYTEEIRKLKAERRKLERRWRMTKLTVDKEIYIQHCKSINNAIRKAKAKYYSEMIIDLESDQKALFKSLDSFLKSKPEMTFPSCNSTEELANNFADYFENKITIIRSDLLSPRGLSLEFESNTFCKDNEKLNCFMPVGEGEVSKLIGRIARKSCHLDPVPSTILKYVSEDLTQVITKIINISTSTASMPSCLKFASLSPRLKKPTLDYEEYNNYRPISNLTFISKCIEKVVASQLWNHVREYKLDETLQSAYKQFHSTETALVRVHNDILTAIDNKPLTYRSAAAIRPVSSI